MAINSLDYIVSLGDNNVNTIAIFFFIVQKLLTVRLGLEEFLDCLK